MSEISSQQYWSEINEMAIGIIDECTDDQLTEFLNGEIEEIKGSEDDITECVYDKVHEWVDGHEWIIYYSYNSDVIRHSDNEGAHEDVGGSELFAGKSYAEIGTIVAFYAMYQDVSDKIYSILQEVDFEE